MAVTTNNDAINIGILLRELYEIPNPYGYSKWRDRPDREAVHEAARQLADAAYKKMKAGIRPEELEGLTIRTLDDEEMAELDELLDTLGVEG